MKLGNSGGKNLGKKYLKIKGDEIITPENQLKVDAFNKWFSDNYFFLKKKITSQGGVFDDEIFHETYIRIATKILYGGLEIKDYAFYFHRSYYTNAIQLAIKENRYADCEFIQFNIIDESKENIEIMKKQDETIQDIKAFVLSHFPSDYDLFVSNMIDGLTYPDLSEQTGIKAYVIQQKISTIKSAIKKEFASISLPHKNRHTAKTTQITFKQDEESVPQVELSSRSTISTSLSDFTASDLMKELYTRGYTGTLSFIQTVDISKVDNQTA